MQYGLGRLPALDPRDRIYSVTPLLRKTDKTKQFWADQTWWGNQGSTSECVAYAWSHWLVDGPVLHSPMPVLDPDQLYHEAQQNDEWDGENYDGTSVRAGAKVLQNHGLISSYHWAFTLDEIINTVLTLGPVVMGTDWYDSMFGVDSRGIITVSGGIAGGHAWEINGVSLETNLFRAKQSWGQDWGIKGHFYIHFSEFEKLLNNMAEACIAVEVPQMT